MAHNSRWCLIAVVKVIVVCAFWSSAQVARAQSPESVFGPPANNNINSTLPAYPQTQRYPQLPAYPQTGVYPPTNIAPGSPPAANFAGSGTAAVPGAVNGPMFAPPRNNVTGLPNGSVGAAQASSTTTVALPGTTLPGASLPGAVDLAPSHVFTSAQIIARVGNETILASDVLPQADDFLKGQIAKMPAEQREQITADEYERQRWIVARKYLDLFVDTKLMYADAMNSIPKENHARIKQDMMEQFEKTQMKAMLEKYKVTTRTELEKKLAENGQSLERQRQLFLEHNISGGWIKQHTRETKEIPVSQILGYYQQNIADYEFGARARWEQLTASFDQHATKDAAFQAIAEMGNDVLRGVPLTEVAKKRSNGPTAANGGERDWTTKGSLKSAVLDEALFGLPVGRMSPVLEDETGFHIIRVVERTEAGRKPFLEAQIEIRKKLKEENEERQKTEFVAKVKQRTPVWTVFDDPNVTIPGKQETIVGRPAEAGRR